MRAARGKPCGPRLIARSFQRVGIKRPRRGYGRFAQKRKLAPAKSRLAALVAEHEQPAQDETRRYQAHLYAPAVRASFQTWRRKAVT